MARDSRTYWEKLKDPRWQQKRLRIMERAEFRCESCGNNEESLQVHHGYYERGLDPWEYDDNTLWCLCEECHLDAQEDLAFVHKMIAHFPPNGAAMEFLVHRISDEHQRWMMAWENAKHRLQEKEQAKDG